MEKVLEKGMEGFFTKSLRESDPDVFASIKEEIERETLELRGSYGQNR